MVATTEPQRAPPRRRRAFEAGAGPGRCRRTAVAAMADPEGDDELDELLREVRRIEVQSRRLVADVMSGGYSSVFRGAGIEFAEVREYTEGDELRAVDWNVTARQGRPYVRKYADEREQTVMFLLDLSASMQGGYGIWSLRQLAARVCACLALAAVHNNDKVGLIAAGVEVEGYVPAQKGLAHALRIVRDCLARRSAALRSELAPALQFAARVLRRRAIVFVVSDFLDDGWAAALRVCARRHDVIAVRLLPPELAPLEAGPVRLRDPESDRTTVVDWGDAAARALYGQRTAAWQQAVRDELRRAGVDCMDVALPRTATDDAVARPILEFFRMRERRGSRR